jgi:putative pyruvate formate lyase activating enzyme
MNLYKNCILCPRRCGVNREEGQRGFCGETAALRLAFAGIHKGEEPPITGAGGSGTVFVSGCNLGCAFCQNHQISHASSKGNSLGRIVTAEEFAEICLALQEHGAENINIVTGSHAAPALALGITAARKQGLCIPVLWNSSGYDGMETLEILKDIVDVYLPDLKTLDREIAARFFNAPDYGEHAMAAILKMMEYRKLRLDKTIASGVMLRHLVIPGLLENTRQVLRWFAENCKGRALLSLMTQYTPVGTDTKIPDRYISEDEYKAVLFMLDEFEIDDGFCQELITGSEWLPDFTLPNPFSSELSVPVSRYRTLTTYGIR